MTTPIFNLSYIPDSQVPIPQSPITSKSATTPKRSLWNDIPKAHPKIDPSKSMQAAAKPKVVKKEPVIDEEFQKILSEGFQAVVVPEAPRASGLSAIKFTRM
jgi:hypothetical protein